MKTLEKKYKSEYGGTLVESMFCMFIICLIFFGLLQIFHWSVAKILCEYSSFYAVKGASLGYNQGIVERAAEVALTGVSGADESNVPVMAPYSRYDLSERAADYMMYSDAGMYGVNFEYWTDHRNSTTPYVRIPTPQTSSTGSYFNARVSIENMPLLHEALSNFVFVDRVDIPAGEATMYNHSQHYLDE